MFRKMEFMHTIMVFQTPHLMLRYQSLLSIVSEHGRKFKDNRIIFICYNVTYEECCNNMYNMKIWKIEGYSLAIRNIRLENVILSPLDQNELNEKYLKVLISRVIHQKFSFVHTRL